MPRVMNLHLDRPLAFIDVETTGLSPAADRIVELTVLKLQPDGTEELKSARLNPQMPIPPEATAIHGITDEDVADKPTFRQYAQSLREFLASCDFGGFNVKRFDLSILEAEFRRAGVEFTTKGCRILDSMFIFHKLEPRDLAAAYRKYCGKEIEDAHTSQADVRAAAEILEAQLERHPELPRDVDALDEFCNPRDPNWIDDEGKFVWSGDEAVFGFGKNRGISLRDMVRHDSEYLEWMANADFSDEVRRIALDALDGRFPEAPGLLEM